MSLILATPVRVVDADIYRTNILENDYSAWNSGTAYSVGDRVIKTSTHMIYECVQAHTNKDPATAANIGTFWVEVSSTNKWRPFDYSTALACVGSNSPIWYRIIAPKQRNTLAVMGVQGSRVTVEVIQLESTRRNFVRYSEELDNAWWTAFKATALPGIGDVWGSAQGSAIEEDVSVGEHYIEGGNVSFGTGNPYTFSVYAQQRTGTKNLMLKFPASAFSSGPEVIFDVTSGTIVSSTAATGAITDMGDGWYRCSITATANATVSDYAARIQMTNGTTKIYLGIGDDIRVTGAMLFNGSTPGTYQWITEPTIYGTRTATQTKVISFDVADEEANPSGDVIFDIDAAEGDYIGVTVTNVSGSDAQLTEIVLGYSYTLGDLLEPHDGSVLDFSRKDRNDFGDVTLIPRGTADTTTYTFRFDRDFRANRRSTIKAVRARPMLWYSDQDMGNLLGLAMFGFWTAYNDALTVGPQVFASLTVESVS